MRKKKVHVYSHMAKNRKKTVFVANDRIQININKKFEIVRLNQISFKSFNHNLEICTWKIKSRDI